MRGVGRVLKPNSFPYFSSRPAPFSSGPGRGRGRGAPFIPDPASPIGKSAHDDNEPQEKFSGRAGLPTQSKTLPENQERGQEAPEPAQTGSDNSPFQTWATENLPGRGRGTTFTAKRERKPISEGLGPAAKPKDHPYEGFGRGKPQDPSEGFGGPVLNEMNRHARPGRPATAPGRGGGRGPELPRSLPASARPKGEEAVKQALGILAKRAEAAGDRPGPGRGGGGGGERGRGRGRGRGRRQDDGGQALSGTGTAFELDDEDKARANAEIEANLKKTFGEEGWRVLSKAIDDVCERVVPNPIKYAIEESLHARYMVDFEPEYAMEEFGTNPDIDEKPPISLREFLEGYKPFLFEVENIKTEEEWKERLEETMKSVPHLKESVHYYAGYGRLTARKEQEHLKAVASQLPDHAHQSVKNLADRAISSLQSNPGWRFDRKYLLMKRLVGDVTQYYEEKHSR